MKMLTPGSKFNKLTIIGLAEIRYGTQAIWLCRCDCGKEAKIPTYRLTNGAVKSCGCVRHRPPGESGLRRLFYSYKSQAINDGKSFLVTLEEFKFLTSSNCFYCDVTPCSVMKMPNYALGSYIYNGLDRLNSLEGYVLNNVVPCCTKCNMMKWVLSKEDFLKHITKIFYYQKRII